MNLTRHNYEEYFLRYVDGELGADERLVVEAFLEEHPDLFEEMDSLQMTVLPQDEVFAFDKNLLYRYTPEERPARVIPLARKRFSVAAAVAIALATSAMLWIARERGFLHTGGPTIAQTRPGGSTPAGSSNGSSNGSPAGSSTASSAGPSTGSTAEGAATASPDATSGGSAPVDSTPAGVTPNGSTPSGAATDGSTPDRAAIAATTTTGATPGAIPGGTTAATATTAVTGATTGATNSATTGTESTAAGSATSTTTGAASAATATLQTASSGDLVSAHSAIAANPGQHNPATPQHLQPNPATGTQGSSDALASKENNPTRPVTTAAPASYHTLEDGDQEADGDKILFVRADQVVNGEVKGFFRRAGRLLKRSTSINNDNVRTDSDR